MYYSFDEFMQAKEANKVIFVSGLYEVQMSENICRHNFNGLWEKIPPDGSIYITNDNLIIFDKDKNEILSMDNFSLITIVAGREK